MIKRVTPSQFRNMIRQAQNKQRQAINKYNQAVRQYNSNVKRSVNEYNRQVRAHNARVRANRQRVVSEISRLMARTASTSYSTLRSSTLSLHRRYELLESVGESIERADVGAEFLDLSERENANSLSVSNALEVEAAEAEHVQDESDVVVANELASLDPELKKRWEGANYALHPHNPDAARHFCTSSREIFTQILDQQAPDRAVLDWNPGCAKTDKGAPVRREKIKFLLFRAGIASEEATNFVDEDVENILELFRAFNDGTHGSAGRFSHPQLLFLKKRVRDGIHYLSSIARS